MAKNIVSFSGGKDSTAMLLLMLENNWNVDHCIFFDTGWEFPEMYEHIKKVQEYTGIEITFVYPNQTFDYYFHDYRAKRGNYKDKIGLSWPDFKNRWCTRYKINSIKKHCNSLGKYIIYEGIALDEPQRKKEGKIYPLVEFGYTEDMALKLCYDYGFDWNGLYEIFNRVSCYRCPLKSIPELKMLHNYKPELWAEMLKADSDTWRSFRSDYTLRELTKRFENENLQMSLFPNGFEKAKCGGKIYYKNCT